MGGRFIPTFGWHRDLPDPRDYLPSQERVVGLLAGLEPQELPPGHLDLRDYCPIPQDQTPLASSSVHACASLVQYFERRATGAIAQPSRLFAYYVARRLAGWKGDTGVGIRTVWKAIAQFGLPPEEVWPYDPPRLDEPPDAFVFASANRSRRPVFVRLDVLGKRGKATLQTVRSFLAAGFPSVFGFPVCSSISSGPDIASPTVFDRILGGQAVMAVGYDDQRWIRSDKGALLILNSWGADWGEDGFGWLPYAYVQENLAVDFWTILHPDWLESGEFARPQ